MITRHNGGHLAECDTCSNNEEVDGDFVDTVAHIKSMRWRVRKRADGTWEHICPVCTEAASPAPRLV